MLGKLLVPGRLTNLDYTRAMAYCDCSRCGWCCLDIFLSAITSLFFSLSLGDGRYSWLVGLVYRPFETVFQSISGCLQKRGRKRRERIDESKNVQTTPTRTYCKRSRPLPYCNQNCRTPRHWKFIQHLRTARPPPLPDID